MLPERGLSIEGLFLSADVACMAGVSQMQWWDERELVSPRIKDHRRVYTTEQVLGDSHSCISPTQGVSPCREFGRFCACYVENWGNSGVLFWQGSLRYT